VKKVKQMSIKEVDDRLSELDKLPVMERIRIKNEMIKELLEDIPKKAMRVDNCNKLNGL